MVLKLSLAAHLPQNEILTCQLSLDIVTAISDIMTRKLDLTLNFSDGIIRCS